LYAAASYEEALAQLASIGATEDAELVEQYRALCFLALNRTSEAERSLERIVLRKPQYKIAEADVSPRLVVMFNDVRKRTLPTSVRELYSKAKADYDTRRFTAAEDQFQQLLAIIKDPDVADRASALAELKQLADGFLALTKAELAASAAAAAAAAAAASVAAAPPPPRAAESTPVIFTAADNEVVPPVEIQKPMPPWSPPPSRGISRMTFRGTLDFVVDERGAVESVRLAKPITSLYDDMLLAAAKQWVFRPATKAGKPVKYRMSVEIVLQPTSH
jgi:tetratricopeptide (TPR) repeat protein